MKTGNGRHAAALSVVAVSALGFLGYRLLGMGATPAPAPAASAVTAQASVPTVGDLPITVIGNPFSHARLAPRKEVEEAGQKPVSVSGLVGLPEIQGGIQIRPEGGPPEAETPAENAGTDRQVEQAPSQLVLSAILRVEQPVALISLNGADSKTFVSGDLVARGIRVVEVGRDFVRIRIGGKIHRLTPGASVTLAQEVAS